MKRRIIAAGLSLMMLCGCAGEKKSAEATIFAMDTFVSVSAYGENAQDAVAAASEEINRLDRLLSVSSADSDILAANSAPSAEISEETAYLIRRSLELSRQTGGAFDITVQPLMELWGFRSGELHIPNDSELSEALSVCGSDKLSLDGTTLSHGEGVRVDLGGIAKGYAADRLREVLSGYEITSAIVSLGGNILCVGSSPDGKPWRVAIASPSGDGNLGVLSVSNCAVVTSGGYQRYFYGEDGTRYHHILNPADGKPARSGAASVTIVSADGALADGLSTALFVMGLEASADFWRAHSDEFGFVYVNEDGRVYVTEGLADSFSCSGEVSVVRKNPQP